MINQKHVKVRLLYLLALTLLVALLALSLGYSSKSLGQVLSVLTGQASQATQFIILKVRLPRIIACLIGGASLAMSGLLLQTLTRNPLADSGILGINTGAGLAVALVISYFDINKAGILSLMPLFAMLGGGLTILLVYLVSLKPNRGISPIRLIITGVGVSSLMSGILISLTSKLNENKVTYVVSWLSGKVTGDDWTTLALITPLMILVWSFTYSRSRQLNIMALNEQTALALGLNLQKERLLSLFLSTLLAALSVLILGNITFVGLVSGHIARKLVGSNHKVSLPAAMLLGMMLVSMADTLGRVLLVGTGIPTGIIVSIIGAPYFLYLLKSSQA